MMRFIKPACWPAGPRVLPRRWARDERGVAAIEFAFVAPVFLMFIFGILEIAFIVLQSSLLNDAGQAAGVYLRNEAMSCTRKGKPGDPDFNCTAASQVGVRQAVCNAVKIGGMSCDVTRLKVAVYSADDLSKNPVTIPEMIEDRRGGVKASRSYVIALGYEWGFGLPTAKLLLTTSGDRTQLQARVFVTTVERALR
jgi:hypothetical protein